MAFAFPLNRRSLVEVQLPIKGARLLRLLPKTDGRAALKREAHAANPQPTAIVAAHP
jgi:hypothetical protein